MNLRIVMRTPLIREKWERTIESYILKEDDNRQGMSDVGANMKSGNTVILTSCDLAQVVAIVPPR